MTTTRIPAEVLTRAGLPAADAENWAASAPGPHGTFTAAAGAVSVFLSRGEALARRLPAPAGRSADERAAREGVAGIITRAPERVPRAHAGALYDALTPHRTRPLTLDALGRRAPPLPPRPP